MGCLDPDSEYAAYPPDERERLRDLDTALDVLSRLTRDLAAPAGAAYQAGPPAPLPASRGDDCDWEHGVCACPGCGHIVRLSVRPGGNVVVLDADNRVHRCERTIAATLSRAGVAGMRPILVKYAQRAPLRDPPTPRNSEKPAPNGQNGHSGLPFPIPWRRIPEEEPTV